MKYLLIILLIISCGKHKQPGMQDYRDSDGDEIPNLLDSNKYVSDAVKKMKVNGTLTFDNGLSIKEIHSFVLTSEVDLTEVSKKLLTQHEKATSGWKFTSDYLVLHLKAPETLELKDESYYVDLNLDANENTFLSIKYLEKNITTDMGRWTRGQTLKLEKRQLQALLKNESHFALEQIKRTTNHSLYEGKTYKLIINDGNKAKLLNISHELPIEKFINLYAKDAKPFIAKDILYKVLSEEETWWVRNMKDYKTIVYASEKELYESYLKGFEKINFTLTRNNGTSKSFQITKHNDAMVILNITGSKTINTFSLRNQKIKFGPQSNNCIFYYRDALETKSELQMKELANEIVLSANNANINEQAKVKSTDSALEVKIDSNDQNIDISLEDLPSSTYQEVGLYRSPCNGRKKVTLLSQENKLVLNVEALVEKI